MSDLKVFFCILLLRASQLGPKLKTRTYLYILLILSFFSLLLQGINALRCLFFFPSEAPKQRWKETDLVQSTSFHYLKLPQWFVWWGEISHTWSHAQSICNASIKLLATCWRECLGTIGSLNIKERLNTSSTGTEVKGDSFQNSCLS